MAWYDLVPIVNTALLFALIVIFVLDRCSGRWSSAVVVYCCVLIFAIAIESLIGHAAKIAVMSTWGTSAPLSLPGSCCFLATAIALYWLSRQH